MRIYVAGPYTAATPEQVMANVQAATDAALRLARRGHQPFLPHLTHYLEERAIATGGGLGYAWYMEYDRYWLQCCEALFLLARSPGADQEYRWALDQGLPVYVDEAAIPDEAAAQRGP